MPKIDIIADGQWHKVPAARITSLDAPLSCVIDDRSNGDFYILTPHLCESEDDDPVTVEIYYTTKEEPR